MAEDIDTFDGSLFDDWGELRPGRIVSPLGGKLRYRQGADIKNWRTPGGQKYLPRDWQMFCGAIGDTFGARTAGSIRITFPVPFADNPLLIATCAGTWPPFETVYELLTSAVNPGAYDVIWASVNNLTQIYFNWIAIGPIGLNV